MRLMRALAFALLIGIPLASCGAIGTTAPTPATIIVIASPTPGPAQATTQPETPSVQQQPTAASGASNPTAAAPIPSIAATEQSLPTAPVPGTRQIRLSQATLIAI